MANRERQPISSLKVCWPKTLVEAFQMSSSDLKYKMFCISEVSSIGLNSSPQPKFCMPILQTHSEAPPTDKFSNSYNKPPAFSLPLVNRITTEGSEIFFVVRFEGEPLPSIQWFANGNLVTEKTSDCKILTDFNKKESILYIREVFVGDEGEYTCKAENISGVAYSTSHLYIKGKTCCSKFCLKIKISSNLLCYSSYRM